MTTPPTELTIVHNTAASRFEAVVDGLTCVAAYHRSGDMIDMHHTGVPRSLEGRGIAAALVQAAVEYARAEGLEVDPHCSYADAWMRRHPEYQGLRA